MAFAAWHEGAVRWHEGAERCESTNSHSAGQAAAWVTDWLGNTLGLVGYHPVKALQQLSCTHAWHVLLTSERHRRHSACRPVQWGQTAPRLPQPQG